VRELPGWTIREIAAGHDTMVTTPDETARLFREIASITS